MIKGKYIGLNQRIPFEVLDAGIHQYLEENKLDKEYIFQRMQEFTSGSNRALKATMYVMQILNRQINILDKLKKGLNGTSYNQLSLTDRKVICLCLICLTFPITYDLLIALAQGFKVQLQISKKFISEKVMSIYGSNRTVDIAIDALLPMIIEFNTVKRDKKSIYSKEKQLSVRLQFLTELVIYADIILSGTKSLLIDDLAYKPWFSYFEFATKQNSEWKYLIQYKESAVGKGYLII